MKGIVQLSGPIDTCQNYKELFSTAQKQWEAENYYVINPIDLADQVQERKPDAEYKDYLAKCINSIASNSINKLVMLPGWQSSFGARMELLFAKRINIEVVFWPSWVEPSKNDDELIYRSILSYMCDLIDMNGMEHVDIKKLFDLMHTYRQRNMNFSTNQ